MNIAHHGLLSPRFHAVSNLGTIKLKIEILQPADLPDQPGLLVVKLEPSHLAHPGHHLGEGLALLKLLNLSFVTLPHLQEDIYS